MIPVNEPLLDGNELEYVTDCIKSGWISSVGDYITKFEQSFAEYCGRSHGVAVSNGTTALQIACRCLDLKPGDEVIMPTFTIISCAQAVVYEGAMPVLVDADPDTWTMDVDQIAEKITAHTRAIMPVHIYGHPTDMKPLLDLAEDHNLAIIEDAAEAHGAEYNIGHQEGDDAWKRCGSFGTLSCFSFYANKLITTGEGGMVLTDDKMLAERAAALRNLCFLPDRRFYHESLGFNFRMTNLQAALGVAQLERIDTIVAKKRSIGAYYTKKLQPINGIQLPVEKSWAKNVYWMYGIVLSEETGLDAVKAALLLREKGVDTRPFFLGMHEQPVFHEMGLFKGEQYPVAERIAQQGLYLPSGLTLTEEQMDIVSTAVKEVVHS
jgi:perosamine synthetase